MSYDIYCYRPVSGYPNTAEAQSLVEADEAAEEEGRTIVTAQDTKDRIVTALITHNPRLERFQFDYNKIAESQKITEAEARARFQHVELNPPEGGLAIQLTVYNDRVFVSFPYWYKGEKANGVFAECSEYLRVIRRTAGFFAYDPQVGTAFDPEKTELVDSKRSYEKIVNDLPKIAAQASAQKKLKAWWKFW